MVGWGEEHQRPQGDMGVGTLSPSQIITQRAEERQAAKELADAVKDMIDHSFDEWMAPVADALEQYYKTLI